MPTAVALVLGEVRTLTVSLGLTLTSALLQSVGRVAAAAVPAVATVPVRAVPMRAAVASAVPRDFNFKVVSSRYLRWSPQRLRGGGAADDLGGGRGLGGLVDWVPRIG